MGRHEVPDSGPTTVVWTLVLVPVALGLLVLAVVVLPRVLDGDGGDSDRPGAAPNAGPSRTPAPGASGGSTTGSPSTTSAVAAPSGTAGGTSSAMPMAPTVAFRLVGTSWIEVRGPDGQVIVSRTFHTGDEARFGQRQVVITIGNAGAVRMTANGMPMRLGSDGQVRRISVTRGGD